MSEGVNRLKQPFGSRLDRSQTVRFRFEGRTYEGFAGDTVASALAAHDVWVLSRSFKYHRPRGILSMAGQDANTLVQLPDEPNVLADLLPLRDGLDIQPQNVNGTLARDRDAIIGRFGRFLPAGFYYQAFYKPRGAWRLWEPFIRRKAGLGRLNLASRGHAYRDKQFLFCDVAVVGGGPGGLSAGLEAARQGASVLVIEEHPRLGGALNYARFDPAGRKAGDARAKIVGAVEADKRIRALTHATCTGLFSDNWLAAVRGDRLYKIRARRVVIAGGGFEQIAVFRNNDLPGIMTGSAAQRLIREFGVRPGRRAVVATGTDDGYALALDLADAGVNVAAIVDFRRNTGSGDCAPAAQRLGIPLLAGFGLAEAHAARGNMHVEGVAVAPLDADGRLQSAGLQHFSCDLLCLTPGWMPAFQLAAQAGGRLRYDSALSAFTPIDLPAGVDVAGSARNLQGIDAVIADGVHAGWRAAKALGMAVGAEPDPVPDHAAPAHSWPIFPHPGGKDFVDFDEDLQVRDIEYTCALGYDDIQLVKRFCTLGMGPSQGRLSALAGARVVAKTTGRTVDDVNVTTARPPYAGEKLALLAGRAFDPVRYTAMHHRHIEAGAQMIPAGTWLRPAFYGRPEERARAIEHEVANVRSNVGLIDVSTLGGLDVRGPDAAEFLDRLYTSSFGKLRVGMSRYALMCNEMGTVIDDGVIARFHERHFYVTATTTGVDAVYRRMLWWNAQWRLEVDVANVTAAYAGVNLAGPRSREVLARVCPGLDLSAAGFPYLGVRAAPVAAIPARILRVGFVGELGYEVHVPAGQGEALWDALVAAGISHRVQPFGVEAQRLLRLEKGHVIISQDTDGISTPDEIGCSWAVRDDKPFFVGQRAIQVIRRQKPARRVVGFTLDRNGPMPEEGNLVLMHEEITGHVTSIGRSSAVGAILGLAFAHVDQSEPGRTLEILLSDGRRVNATVVKLPFYDPAAKRQAG